MSGAWQNIQGLAQAGNVDQLTKIAISNIIYGQNLLYGTGSWDDRLGVNLSGKWDAASVYYIDLAGSARGRGEIAWDVITLLPFGEMRAVIGFEEMAKLGEVTRGVEGSVAKSLATEIKVIGRQADTQVALDWAGHDVLNVKDWTPAKNVTWVKAGIAAKQPFYLASPTAALAL